MNEVAELSTSNARPPSGMFSRTPKSLDEALSAHARQRLTQGVPPGGGFLRG